MYIVSYQLKEYPSLCGNQSHDTLNQAKDYIQENKWKWTSHSLFVVGKCSEFGGVQELEEVK